jgi:hypothetical protein
MYLDEAKALLEKTSEIFDEKLRRIEPFGSGSSTYRSCSPPALGIHPKAENTYQLAVRLTYESDRSIVKPILDEIGQDKIDLRVTGPIIPFTSFANPKIAITHRDSWHSGAGKYGSIGCFVRKRGQSELLILSNNHVLANINNAQESDLIIQLDAISMALGSKINSYLPLSRRYNDIASLKEFITLRFNEVNLVDAAIARLNQTDDIYIDRIRSLCRLKGFHNEDFFTNNVYSIPLYKRGITTNVTEGKITAFNVRTKVQYASDGSKPCNFINVIEIRCDKSNQKFSLNGDSGAVIHDRDGYAVALLFAGNAATGMTYAVPIKTVLDALNLDLVLDCSL